jgi:hypothetical protein
MAERGRYTFGKGKPLKHRGTEEAKEEEVGRSHDQKPKFGTADTEKR